MAQARLKPSTEAKRMRAILAKLHRLYPESGCSLTHQSPFHLLVSTILSAQCTDRRVNQITPKLFARFPGPREMAEADRSEIELLIQSAGFFRTKALALQSMSSSLIEKFGAEVPSDLPNLLKLRGVGRKTANVVLGVAFGKPALVVDTHVTRLAFRMGFTQSQDPVRIEQDLMALTPRAEWSNLAHLFIDHGRAICPARSPRCKVCALANLCPQKKSVRAASRATSAKPK